MALGQVGKKPGQNFTKWEQKMNNGAPQLKISGSCPQAGASHFPANELISCLPTYQLFIPPPNLHWHHMEPYLEFQVVTPLPFCSLISGLINL